MTYEEFVDEYEELLLAQVGDRARVGDGAQVGNWARVGNWAQVEGEHLTSPLYIIGSVHPLTNSRPGYIAIGCQEHTFEYWKKHFRRIGKENGYTPEQITEYGKLIRFIAAVGRK